MAEGRMEQTVCCGRSRKQETGALRGSLQLRTGIQGVEITASRLHFDLELGWLLSLQVCGVTGVGAVYCLLWGVPHQL